MPINDRRYCSTYNKNALGSAWRRRENETLAKGDNTKQKQKREQPESISVALKSAFDLFTGYCACHAVYSVILAECN
ncbi:hypothetical protein CLOSTMETH_03551 [[Clostridium] methylpentosum DSM 5476]|uniref:Uncharacterized protein n=1 Tax=[Clostridium] methylpentosum DSM 5476 TaxID=537013 RepID=C0EI56_9FIRM|nr:hypothetical protein CLOSTMETH_03551 [[Clostridium] methylpentosum DSM 5476]